MPDAAPDLTLLVPFFNEDGRVDRCLQAAQDWSEAHPDVDLEVLCVDDGSTDDTAERLADRARAWHVVRLLELPGNRGKGAALKAGMPEVRGCHVIFLDADLAVDLSHLDHALDLLQQGADVVIGCRNVPGSAVRKEQRWPRRWLGKGYLRLARLVLGLRVSDVTCGFKGFRREVAQSLFECAACRRWGFDAEILHLAQRAGCGIREMPVQWFDGEVSAVRLYRDVFGAFRELCAVRLRHLFRAAPRLALAAPPPQPQTRRVASGPLRDG